MGFTWIYLAAIGTLMRLCDAVYNAGQYSMMDQHGN